VFVLFLIIYMYMYISCNCASYDFVIYISPAHARMMSFHRKSAMKRHFCIHIIEIYVIIMVYVRINNNNNVFEIMTAVTRGFFLLSTNFVVVVLNCVFSFSSRTWCVRTNINVEHHAECLFLLKCWWLLFLYILFWFLKIGFDIISIIWTIDHCNLLYLLL